MESYFRLQANSTGILLLILSLIIVTSLLVEGRIGADDINEELDLLHESHEGVIEDHIEVSLSSLSFLLLLSLSLLS